MCYCHSQINAIMSSTSLCPHTHTHTRTRTRTYKHTQDSKREREREKEEKIGGERERRAVSFRNDNQIIVPTSSSIQ